MNILTGIGLLCVDAIFLALFLGYCGIVKKEAGPNSLATTPMGKTALLMGFGGATVLLAGVVIFFFILAIGSFAGVVIVDFK